MKRFAAVILIIVYLSVGSMFGATLYEGIPAVNILGAAYVTLTWPLWLRGSPINMPIPAWAFTFKEN